VLERRNHDTSRYAIRFNRRAPFMGKGARGGGSAPPPLD
jgi:hypothetical protein